MAVKRTWTHYLVYVSLLCVGVVLYDTDYLAVPDVVSPSYLLASMIGLLAGFAGTAVSWQRTLHRGGYPVSFKQALAAVGLPIFAKYVPGKIWVVVGRAGYLAERGVGSLGALSSLSLNAQLITLWVGLVLGAMGALYLDGLRLWGGLVFALLLTLTLLVFTRRVHDLAELGLLRLTGRRVRVPILRASSVVAVMPWFCLTWICWGAGFFCLAASLSAGSLPWVVGLGFPLAATLGIMAVVVPGGLGVREGVLVGYLLLGDVSVTDATAIALAARLWFLSGEAAVFIAGWSSSRSVKPALNT